MGWKIDQELKDKSYTDLKAVLKDKVKQIRNMLTTIEGQYFDIIWKEGSEDDRIKLLELVQSANKGRLTYYLLRHKAIPVASKPYWYLMEVCKQQGITNYGRMSRPELIKTVEKLNGQDQQTAVQEDERTAGGDVSNNQ